MHNLFKYNPVIGDHLCFVDLNTLAITDEMEVWSDGRWTNGAWRTRTNLIYNSKRGSNFLKGEGSIG